MNDYKDRDPRSIKVLLNSAAQGDVKAQFQLAEYYNTGKYVDKDEALAVNYFAQVLAQSQTFSLKVRSLNLFCFRRFEKQQPITFHPQTTVFAGNNGSGKTSIIEALWISLSWLTAFVKNSNGVGHYLHERDINNKPASSFAVVTTGLSVQSDLNYQSTLAKPKPEQISRQKSELTDLRQLAEIYRYGNADNSDFALPIMAYYSVGRSIELKAEDFEYAKKHGDKKRWQKLDAYNEPKEESKNFREFLSWFIRIDNINKSVESNRQAKALLTAEITILQRMIAQLDLFNDGSQTLIDKLQLEITEAQEKQLALIDPDALSVAMAEKVMLAITTFIPSIKNIRINHSQDKVDMLMEKDDVTISALQLSQGEKSLFSLVGDIARRLVMLNPATNNNPLHGKGIVIIDEIDLHLHPSWQQKVVGQLNSTFPNIQFILTTHSPQVLSTVKPECIRIIKDSEISTPDFSLGAESKQLLQDLQEVPSRSPNLTVVKELMEYQALITADQWDSDKAAALREKLMIWAGNSDPVMLKLDMDIRLRKRRRVKK